ncbi:MAG: hypothetical protein AAYR33_08015 [Acetobacteraceae bacterium]
MGEGGTSGWIDNVNANNGTLDISNVTTLSPSIKALDGTSNTILGQKTLTLSNANSTFGNNYAEVMSGTGGLIIAAGTQILSGQNTYTGATSIGSGVHLTLGDGGTSGFIGNTASIANDGELTINHSDKVTLHGAISEAGRLNHRSAAARPSSQAIIVTRAARELPPAFCRLMVISPARSLAVRA